MNRNILVALFLMCIGLTTSVSASDLIQMDIKKTSENDLNVTFFATEISDSPIVTRKSDNKYVVLMPNVKGENAGKPDYSALKDLLTDVDIKNIDDGMGGYTKVTFITKKPVNIKTSIQKTAPLSTEEKDTRDLISVVKIKPVQKQDTPNAIDIKKATTTTSAGQISAPKKNVTANLKSISDTKTNAQNNKIVDNKKNSQNTNVSKMAVANKTIVSSPPKNELQTEENFLEVFDERKLEIEDISAVETLKTDNQVNEKFVIDEKQLAEIEKISDTHEHEKKAGGIGFGLILFPLFVLYLLAKIARNSVRGSKILKESFRDNLAKQPITQGTYEDIINTQELNWQERYQKFLEESKGQVKNKNYKFISIPKTDKSEVIKINEPTKDLPEQLIEEKRKNLEKIFSEPEKNTFVDETTEEEMISLPSLKDVISEDEVIQRNLKHIKLKSFAKAISLSTSSRNRVKKALPKAHKLTEGKYVELQESTLNKSVRRFKDANLRVADLINTGNQYIHEKEKGVLTMGKNYIMSSMDEYFALLDKEQSKTVSYPNKELSSKVAASLAKVKPSMSIQQQNTTKHISNPISQKRENTLNGLIVKSGYAIDENKGFYIVNLDGTMALIGRNGDDINVLKKFDLPVNNLQVRHDSGNVYMVKAGDFKSLVDAEEMGILIEL